MRHLRASPPRRRPPVERANGGHPVRSGDCRALLAGGYGQGRARSEAERQIANDQQHLDEEHETADQGLAHARASAAAGAAWSPLDECPAATSCSWSALARNFNPPQTRRPDRADIRTDPTRRRAWPPKLSAARQARARGPGTRAPARAGSGDKLGHLASGCTARRPIRACCAPPAGGRTCRTARLGRRSLAVRSPDRTCNKLRSTRPASDAQVRADRRVR